MTKHPRAWLKDFIIVYVKSNLTTMRLLQAAVINEVEGFDWTNVQDPVADAVMALAEAGELRMEQANIAGTDEIIIRGLR